MDIAELDILRNVQQCASQKGINAPRKGESYGSSFDKLCLLIEAWTFPPKLLLYGLLNSRQENFNNS